MQPQLETVPDILLHRLPTMASRSLVHVVIDTPMGSRQKYKYDDRLACFRLSRILPAGASFPHDFGSIPRTLAEDGDALDVLILSEVPSFVGCVMSVQLIGGIRGKQSDKGKSVRNDRLIAVPVTSVNPPAFRHIDRLPADRMKELQHFFQSYNQAQGRTFSLLGTMGPSDALTAVRDASRRYQKRSDA